MASKLMKEFHDIEELSQYINNESEMYRMQVDSLKYDSIKNLYRLEYKLFIRV